jgi:hypothetical protein
MELWHEKYGVFLCNRGCENFKHFHVSTISGKAISIRGDEENIRYFINHARIVGYRDGRTLE